MMRDSPEAEADLMTDRERSLVGGEGTGGVTLGRATLGGASCGEVADFSTPATPPPSVTGFSELLRDERSATGESSRAST